MLCGAVGILVEPRDPAHVALAAERLIAFAALGFAAAAANLLLAERSRARARASQRRASSPRYSRRSRARSRTRAFAGAAAELGADFTELDGARESVATLTDAQVTDVQRLTQSM